MNKRFFAFSFIALTTAFATLFACSTHAPVPSPKPAASHVVFGGTYIPNPVVSGGGGGSSPTGTGVALVSSGAFVSAAGPVPLDGGATYVDGALPLSNQAAPTGSGFVKASADAWVSAAESQVALTSEVTGVLPFANMAAPTGSGVALVSAGAFVTSAGPLQLDAGTSFVDGSLPLANMSSPTGTGFVKVNSGSWSTTESQVSAASDLDGSVPIANGGTALDAAGSDGAVLLSNGGAYSNVLVSGDGVLSDAGALSVYSATGDSGIFTVTASESDFGDAASKSFNKNFIASTTTTSGTPATYSITQSASSNITLIINVQARVTGGDSGTAGDGFSQSWQWFSSEDAGGTITDAAPTDSAAQTIGGGSSFSASLSVSSSTIVVTLTGASAVSVDWTVTVQEVIST